MQRNINAAAVQYEHAPGDKEANLSKVRRFAEQAAKEGVEILVFPECCLTGYWYLRTLNREQLLELAEPVPDGPMAQSLKELAVLHGMIIGAGLIELAGDGRLFNCYVAALPDGEVHFHRKIHTFINAEISSGDSYTVFDTPFQCKIGVLTCYDNNLVENARITALMGAEILLSPHQTGGCKTRSPHAMGVIDQTLWHNRHKNPEAIEAEFKGDKGRGWITRWLPARAHDNGMFLIFANGVGIDGDEVRTGNSMILDPYGRILTETWKADDAMVAADLEAELLPTSTGRRWLQARRPELYEPLTQATGNERSIREVRFGKEGM